MSKVISMEGKSIRELVEELNHHLPGIYYRSATIARLNVDWSKLIAYADERGIEVFTMELGRAFVWDVYGSILGDKDTSHNVNRAIHTLTFVADNKLGTGKSAAFQLLEEADPTLLILFHAFSGANYFTVAVLINRDGDQALFEKSIRVYYLTKIQMAAR